MKKEFTFNLVWNDGNKNSFSCFAYTENEARGHLNEFLGTDAKDCQATLKPDVESIKKGDLIKIQGNEIFEIMGFKTVTGKVRLVTPDSIHFDCNETGAIELADKTEGTITVTEAA